MNSLADCFRQCRRHHSPSPAAVQAKGRHSHRPYNGFDPMRKCHRAAGHLDAYRCGKQTLVFPASLWRRIFMRAAVKESYG